MRICILNCDFDESPSTNGASLIKRNLIRMGISEEDISVFDVFKEEMPQDITRFQKVVITGSRASVYEDKKWIKQLIEMIKEINTRKIPTLGICFGFQAVAEALGGKVKSSGSFEEGFGHVELTQAGNRSSIFSGFERDVLVYQSHGDIASALPENSEILAKNEHSTQAYSLENFYCVQFHPEIIPPVALEMGERDGKKREEVLNGTPETYRKTLSIIENFISIEADG